jgi:hypothetical protein
MRLILFLILFPLVAGAQLSVNVFTDMENSTDGTILTGTIASNGSHGGSGTWATEKDGTLGGTLTEFRVRANAEAEATLRGPVSANSTTYTDSGSTRGWKMHNTAIWELLRYTFPATTNAVSIGFAWKLLNGWKAGFESYDLAGIETTGGDFALLNMFDHTSTMKIDLHTGGSPGTTAETPVNTNQWYWVTMKLDVNDKAYMRVYNMSTWLTLVNTNLALGASPGKCLFAFVGRYDNHGSSTADAYHVYDDFLIDETGANFPLLPPGATITASSVSRTAFDEAYTNAASGGSRQYQDTILLPTGSNSWSSGYTISKTLTISGSGSNGNQTVIHFAAPSAEAELFSLKSTYCSVSNLQLRSVDVDNGWLVVVHSNWSRVRDVHFIMGLSPTIQYGFGLVYNCTFYNGTRMGRCFSPSEDNVFGAYGSPYDISIMGRTNFSVWENNRYYCDSGATAFPITLSSQDGGMWIIRHCEIISSQEFGPCFDAHGAIDGGNPETGVIAFQLYSNYVSCTGPRNKFVDQRGAMSLIYSNYALQAWNDDIYLRRDDGTGGSSYFTPGPQVTNSYIWANLENAGNAMPIVVETGDVSVITTNQSYFGVAPATNYVVQYPHFLREGVTHDPALSGAQVTGSQSITQGARRLRFRR